MRREDVLLMRTFVAADSLCMMTGRKFLANTEHKEDLSLPNLNAEKAVRRGPVAVDIVETVGMAGSSRPSQVRKGRCLDSGVTMSR